MHTLSNNGLSYKEQLETPQWFSCRESIINRDHHACCLCGRGASKMISFGDDAFSIGIDNSKGLIDFKSTSKPLKLSDYISDKINKRLKKGVVNSQFLGLLSGDGEFFYTPWTKEDNSKNLDIKKSFVARTVCDDGYVANIVFFQIEELEDLKLPRIYIQKNPLVLQVHHKRYIVQHNAWDYEDNDLVTLCNECHSKVHKYLPTKVYTLVDGIYRVLNYTPCSRCNGTGYFPEYKNIQGGICFRCQGERFEEFIPSKYNVIDL